MVYYYFDLHEGRELVNLFKGIVESDLPLLWSLPPTTSEAVGRALLSLFQVSFLEERHGRRGGKIKSSLQSEVKWRRDILTKNHGKMADPSKADFCNVWNFFPVEVITDVHFRIQFTTTQVDR